MKRDFYLELARKEMAMPIGSHLMLHRQPDPEATRRDGRALGQVLIETAREFATPLAFPLMDLQIEKEFLLAQLGIGADRFEKFHFTEGGPTEADAAKLHAALATAAPTAKMSAACEAIRTVAQVPDLVPMGMCIGPFSLFTKLHADPITLVYSAAGDPDADEERAAVLRTLEMTTEVILHWLRAQIAAGAKAVCVCEPACNLVYLSPKQLDADPGMLEYFVLSFNRRIRALFAEHDVDLVFHDCGEVTSAMIRAFGTLDPAVLSLGSSVSLWDAAAHVPQTTVLYGNLPTKKFYSDAEYPIERVSRDSTELRKRMKCVGHPFILGSECDVLCVHGSEHTIWNKVQAMLSSSLSPETPILP
ncbi:uroporphyrinogen decarboxylase family protein [Nibricoccus sp. IMCC34717]|uniref:uroporphyrinogen decarboxylase family protein n=1 Tax=Nibricoccus sp. IMCC34717 TaxID=3034021 RepID=UPI00384EEDF0